MFQKPNCSSTFIIFFYHIMEIFFLICWLNHVKPRTSLCELLFIFFVLELLSYTSKILLAQRCQIKGYLFIYVLLLFW